DDEHFLTVCRYVEANPIRAGLVKRAEDWRWSSHSPRSEEIADTEWPDLSAWPMQRPANWSKLVNTALPKRTLGELQISVNRGRPYGDSAWVQRAARRLGLAHTLRPPGRPRRTARTPEESS